MYASVPEDKKSMTLQATDVHLKVKTLRRSIMLAVSLVLIISLTFTTAILLNEQRSVLTEAAIESVSIDSNSLISQLAPATKFKQSASIAELYSSRALELGSSDILSSAMVKLADGTPLASYQSTELSPFNLDQYWANLSGPIDTVVIDRLVDFTVFSSPLVFGPDNQMVGSVVMAWDLAPLHARLQRGLLVSVAVSLSSTLLLLLTTYLILGRLLTRPLSRLSTTMLNLADNHEDLDVPFLARKDEIGVMARTVDIFRINLIETHRLRDQKIQNMQEQQNREKEENAREQELLEAEKTRYAAGQAEALQQREAALALQDRVDGLLRAVSAAAQGNLYHPLDTEGDDLAGQMARALDSLFSELRANMHGIGINAVRLSEASDNLTNSSVSMNNTVSANSENAQEASVLSQKVNVVVDSVLSATEELSSSIKEIARNSAEAELVASDAVQLANTTDVTVRKLSESSAGISHVIKVITSIAEQTNLLALNATIEAARAGDAGKGFAVVANEVKELAKETAKATVQIESRINDIQVNTSSAVNAIESIGSIINRINEIQSTIAIAIDEQSQVTTEISQAISQTATGSDAISSLIQNVAKQVEVSQNTSDEVNDSAGELAEMASQLQQLVSKFSNDPQPNTQFSPTENHSRVA